MMKIGVGYRWELLPWLDRSPGSIRCVELTAEHFYNAPNRMDRFQAWLRQRPARCDCFVHGLGLSLGTPGPLNSSRLKQFAEVAAACNACWVSEHVAFTRTAETDLGHLNPIPPTRDSLRTMADHALELSVRCQKPLLLENITAQVRLPGELSETEFLNELCARGGCGLLLDVTNLYVNSQNHHFDPVQWLREIEPSHIRQLHIVGYSVHQGRYTDDHSQPIQAELLTLAQRVLEYAPVQAMILERDHHLGDPAAIDAEIAKLENLCGIG